MELRIKNWYNDKSEEIYDGYITDPPYKGCISGALEEKAFDIELFMQKAFESTKKDGFLIVFTNFAMSYDLREAANKIGWKFHTYQIWDKTPTRTWIAWSIPTRTCEFVLYFTKGNFKLDFRDGTEKPAIKRSSFGGDLKNTTKNTNKKSYGMYSEIMQIPLEPKKERIHPTQKPKVWSKIFKQIVGDVCVCDPFCGSGSLISSFLNAIGYDIKDWINK